MANPTVNWLTGVISIPKSYLTTVQILPTEILQLDTNLFRLKLRDLEDDVDGRPWPKTHLHNTTVVVGGVTLARVIEVLEPYTVTFEDGQYAVNLVGSNSNIGDRVNVNQVSVRSSNSAGLVDLEVLLASAYGGIVVLNQDTGQSGTSTPIGTIKTPSGNIEDSIVIAKDNGIRTIYNVGQLTIGLGHDLSSMEIRGQSTKTSELIIEAASNTLNTEIQTTLVSGVLDNNTNIGNCDVKDLSYFSGEIRDSQILSKITLGNGAQANIINCWGGNTGQVPSEIDFGGSGQSLILSGYRQGIRFTNKTGPESVSVSLDGGQVRIDLTTVINGRIVVRGVGRVVDDATGDWLPHGTYGNLILDNETTYGVMLQELWTAHGLDADVTPTEGILIDNLDDKVSSRSTHTAQDIWDVAIRTLTANTALSEEESIKLLSLPQKEDNAIHLLKEIKLIVGD